MRVESVLLFSFLGCYKPTTVGVLWVEVEVGVGLGERPLFAWVNVLRWTGWVTAGVFNPKNLSLLNTITNFSVHCSH